MEPFSFDEVGFEFPGFGNSNAQGFDRPKRKIPVSQSYPDPQGYNSAEEVDDGEYHEPVYRTPYYENGNRETPRIVRHSVRETIDPEITIVSNLVQFYTSVSQLPLLFAFYYNETYAM